MSKILNKPVGAGSSSMLSPGGGEMGEFIREFDWSATSLGSSDTWPQSLRTTLSIMLTSKFPMFLWWGPELVCFYNDAYRPCLGNDGKHPGALGKPAEVVWPEIWHIIKPLIDQVLSTGESVWSEDQLVPIYRNGRMEDVYWTFSYSPVNDESDIPAAVLVTCMETTQKVINLKKLEESNDQLKFAIEATELGVWDYNPINKKFTNVNERLKEWFGLSFNEEMILPQAIEIIAEKDRQRVTEAIYYAFQYASGGIYDIDFTIIHPITQRERIVRAKGKAWFNDQKIAYRFNGTLQDITTEVLSRKHLETREAMLQSIIATAPAGIGLFMGRDLIIELPNQTFIDIVGKGPDIVGKPLREVMPELLTEGQPFLKILDEVYTTGKMFQSFGSQVKIVQNGVMTYNYYNITYTPLFDVDGKVYAILDIAIDVTEDIKSQKKIEESEKNLRSTILQAPVAMCILRGSEHIVEIANDRMCELWGAGPEVVGKPIFEFLPEAREEGFETLLNHVFNTGETFKAYEQPVTLPRNNGLETVYVDFVYEAFREADDSISGIMVIATDVTKQVIARKKTEESAQQIRSLLESAPFPIGVYVGKEMRIQFANQSMLDGWAKGDNVIGKLFSEVLPEFSHQKIFEQLEAVYLTGVPFYAKNQRLDLVVNGKLQSYYYNYYFTPLFNSEGEIYGIMNTASNVTDLKNSQKELELKNNQLIRINNDLDNFIYTASHDLKAPMSNIEGLLYSLKDNLQSDQEPMSEETSILLQLMEQSIDRFKTTILDLTEITKVQKVEEEDIHEIDIDRLVEDVTLSISDKIKDSGAIIKKDFSKEPLLRFSKKNLKSIVYNLLSNAIKYGDKTKGIEVFIKTEKVDNYTILSFEDNGLGISEKNLKKIFTMFKRFHDHVEGTGIGLYIVKRIVENAGGKIEVESEVGRGSTFKIYFRD